MQKKLKIDNFAGIVLVVILSMIVLEFLFIFNVVSRNFEEQQKQELSRYVSFISQSLEESMAVTQDYDALQNSNLYEKAKNIRNDLEGVAAIDISYEDLEALKEKHGFTGVAIFAPSDGDVIILSSTNKDEVGLSTKSWTYWNTAFKQLLNEEPVDVGRGQYFPDFWVGPKTKSHTLAGYFKFGYIYNRSGDYLINVYVQSDEMIADRAAGSVNNTLDDIRENIDYVDHIGIVKADILKAYRETEYEGSRKEPLILYGDIKNTGFTKIDYDVDNLMLSGNMLFEELGRNNQKLVLKKLNDSEMLVIIINSNKMDYFLNSMLKFTVGLSLLAGAMILLVNFWMIRKYGALLGVERKRLNLVRSFQKTIQSMPAMLFHCYQNEMGEVVLSYNDGRYFSQDELVLSNSDHIKMDKLYSEEFMEVASEHIEKAFNHTKSRFEAEYGGRVFDVIVSPVYETTAGDGEKIIKEIIGFGSEISDRVNREKEAAYLATHDLLTGLPNRMAFIEALEDKLEVEEEVFVIYFDLDKFKEINDTYGHHIGDEVLKVIAGRLKLYTNNAFRVARMGGDEFVACCSELDIEDVKLMTKRIIDTLGTPIEVEDITCHVGASAGIAAYPENGETAEVLISKADKAMYSSKRDGGNAYHIG